MRLAALLLLLPSFAFAEWQKESTITTSGSTARSGVLRQGLKYIECDQVAYLNFGGSTIEATTADQRIAQYERYRWVVVDAKYVAAIGSVGNCNIWRSTVGSNEPLPFTQMQPTAAAESGGGDYEVGSLLAHGADNTTVLTFTAASGSDSLWDIGGSILTTTWGGGYVGLELVYTDCRGNSRAIIMTGDYSGAPASLNNAGLGPFLFYPHGTCVNDGSTVVVRTIWDGSSTSDWHAWARRVAQL